MSGKNQCPIVLGPNAVNFSLSPNQPGISWQATTPVSGFLPLNLQTQSQGSTPSGNPNGAMASTNTIYSQIIDVSRMDNMGLEVTWTGTPTGTISVMVSNSGINFYALTFSPSLTQPSGAGGGYAVNLNQLPFKYVMLQYVNSTGSGTLTIFAQAKDLN